VSPPNYAEQYEQLIRELRDQGLLTPPDPMPDDPELSLRYWWATWAMCCAAGLVLAVTVYGFLLGLLYRHVVVTVVGLAALVPGLLIARPALRRLHAISDAERRLDEWTARQPGGRERLRARMQQRAIRAAVGLAALYGSTAMRDPVMTLLTAVFTIVVLLLVLPQIREQVRWYRDLTAEPGAERRRRRHRRRGKPRQPARN
jgi:hypothetical protein